MTSENIVGIYDVIVEYIEGYRKTDGYTAGIGPLEDVAEGAYDEGGFADRDRWEKEIEERKLEYLNEYDKVILEIRKSRTFLKEDIVEGLLGLIDEMYDREATEKALIEGVHTTDKYKQEVKNHVKTAYFTLEGLLGDYLP